MSNTNPRPKAKRQGVMMGSSGDNPGSVSGKGYDYKGNPNGPGRWVNRNGTQVGESDQEDSTIRNKKSTGDTIAPRTYKYDPASYAGPADPTTRRGRNGVVTNSNGKTVGYGDVMHSAHGDQAGKSTGDRPASNITPLMKAARKKRLTKGG